jgi:peroxiredoxin
MASELIQLGMPAPDFALTATDGTRFRLSDLRGKSRIILYFIRAFN